MLAGGRVLACSQGRGSDAHRTTEEPLASRRSGKPSGVSPRFCQESPTGKATQTGHGFMGAGNWGRGWGVAANRASFRVMECSGTTWW